MSDTPDDYDLAVLQVKAQERRQELAEREQQLPAARLKIVALLEVVRAASLQNATTVELWLFDQAIKAVKGAR